METNQNKRGTYGSQTAEIMSEAEHFENPKYSDDSWVGAWSTTPVRFDLKEFLNFKREISNMDFLALPFVRKFGQL